MTRSESIGSVSSWQLGDNLDLPYDLAQTFLAYVLGEPPTGVRIGIRYREHELGAYPMLAVVWEEGMPEPWNFIRRAENALTEFDGAVDWSRLHPSRFDAEEEDD